MTDTDAKNVLLVRFACASPLPHKSAAFRQNVLQTRFGKSRSDSSLKWQRNVNCLVRELDGPSALVRPQSL